MTLTQNFPALARQLFAKGLEPIPIAPGQKYPTQKGWQNASTEPLLKTWKPEHGVGIRTGKTGIGLDLDIYHADMVDDITGHCFKGIDILQRVGQPPKTLIPVLCPEIESKITSEKYADENGVINQIEVLSKGQQFVAYGIHPGTSKPYEWSGDLLTHSLPKVSPEFIQELFFYFQALAIAKGWTSLTKIENKVKKGTAATYTGTNKGNEPGSIYNRTVSIQEVLSHYGWKKYRGNYWTRPGKEKGISAAIHDSIAWIFTSSTCLPQNTACDAFELVTQYEFNGDKSSCARELRRLMV